jgi:hypothetical protein
MLLSEASARADSSRLFVKGCVVLASQVCACAAVGGTFRSVVNGNVTSPEA